MPNVVEVQKYKGQWIANQAVTKGGNHILWSAPEIGYTVNLREHKDKFKKNAEEHPVVVEKGDQEKRKTKRPKKSEKRKRAT